MLFVGFYFFRGNFIRKRGLHFVWLLLLFPSWSLMLIYGLTDGFTDDIDF